VGNGAAHARDPGTGFHRAGRGRFAAPYRAVARRGVRREWPSRARRATAPNCSARRQFPRLRRARWGPTTATPITAGTGKATESPTSPAVARFFGESTTEPASERTTVEQPETKLAHRRVLRAGGGSAERRRAVAGVDVHVNQHPVGQATAGRVDGPIARVAVRLFREPALTRGRPRARNPRANQTEATTDIACLRAVGAILKLVFPSPPRPCTCGRPASGARSAARCRRADPWSKRDLTRTGVGSRPSSQQRRDSAQCICVRDRCCGAQAAFRRSRGYLRRGGGAANRRLL
jgi:hypothetical protein